MTDEASQIIEDGGSAPTYSVPEQRVVSIEHPCIVNNFDNGFKSLGGEHQLKDVLEHRVANGKKSGNEPVVAASLRPDDPFAKRLSSTAAPTQNILVKVTLPKRTGRKRKRGSDEPFSDPSSPSKQSHSITAPELLQRLRDNPSTYTMQAVGVIQETHHFQGLPDFQTRAEELPIMREIRDHVMIPEYDKLKRFHIDSKLGRDRITAFPGPPSFLPVNQPYQYEYKQARGNDKPKPISKAGKASSKFGPSMLEAGTALDTEQVPQGPSVQPSSPGRVARISIDALKALLDERPVISLRAAASLLDRHHVKLSYAVKHVGYYINKGPWEGTIVKYGIDPRTDPKYRFYQTLQFNVYNVTELNADLQRRGGEGQSHVFDGKQLLDVGKYWQLCDLTDPILQRLVNSVEVRAECDSKDFGWYFNGTLAKIRVIMREKLIAFWHPESKVADSDYDILASLPTRVHSAQDCQLQDSQDHVLQQLAMQIGKEAMNGPLKHDRRLRQLTNGRVVEEEALSTEDAAEEDEELGDPGKEQDTAYTSEEESEEEEEPARETSREE